MDALRNVYSALGPNGELVDLHPVPPAMLVESRGEPLGRVDESAFFPVLRATEGALQGLVEAGLFELSAEREFDWLQRWDDGAELLADFEEDEFVRVPAALGKRIRSGEPPFDVRVRLVLRRFARRPG